MRVAAAAVIKSLAQESGYIATSDFDTCLNALCKGFEVCAQAVWVGHTVAPTLPHPSSPSSLTQGSEHETRMALAEAMAVVCVSALADETWQVRCIATGGLCTVFFCFLLFFSPLAEICNPLLRRHRTSRRPSA